MTLFAKHENFCQLVAAGVDHQRAYHEAGFKAKHVRQAASKTLKKPAIAARIKELQDAKERAVLEAHTKLVQEAKIDKKWIIDQLIDVVATAKAAKPVLDREGNPTGEYQQNLSAANQALKMLGTELGMFVERKEVRTGPLDSLEHAQLLVLQELLMQTTIHGQATLVDITPKLDLKQ